MDKKYDVLVIGAGPGGYVAAIEAAQLGAKTAIAEKTAFGGTCLNRGCIPTKALLACGEKAADMQKHAKDFGLEVPEVILHFEQMQKRKERIVMKMRKGIEFLMKQNQITTYCGEASFVDMHHVQIGEEVVFADKIIIATGSVPRKLRFLGENARLLDSDQLLQIDHIPQSLIIIGGGVIGVEFSNVMQNLGCQVTIVEMLPEILPPVDGELAKTLHKELQKQGIKIMTAAKVLKAEDDGQQAVVTVEKEDGLQTELNAELVLVAPGRAAYWDGLSLENAGVQYEKNGILVNENLQTNIPHIYAIGDVLGKVQLAHLASAQGICAAGHALQKKRKIDCGVIPSCIYTSPEVAGVGLTEEECQKQKINYAVSKFLFQNNGKAQTLGMGGFLKLLYEKETKKILGLHIIGPHATDLIAEGALAMVNDLTVSDIAKTVHPHPTLSEALWEAAREAEKE